MKPEVKEKFINALRSGKYKQGFFGLRMHTPESTQYCVLGVLCNIHAEETGNQNKWENNSYMNRGGWLPVEVAEWAGVSTCPEVDIDGELIALSRLNDKGKSFEYLANILEEAEVVG